jgi:site-specific DNA-methyltransferase (cytosine-N4-specific)
MIANELAIELADRYISRGNSVLDPFCGTGRTLLAAEQIGAAEVVGIDVNPLATLIARAKFAPVSCARLRRLLSAKRRALMSKFDFERRKVSWFSKNTRRELTEIINTVNKAAWLTRGDRTLVAAVVSATARHVSYCRNDQWKLHRISLSRRRVRVATHAVFARRLESAIQEIGTFVGRKRAKAWIIQGSCADIGRTLARARAPRLFDVVITSPPYGDSVSTVQYGGVSSICLDVIRHLKDVLPKDTESRDIDRRCLGASQCHSGKEPAPYWAGGVDNLKRGKVVAFLSDMERSCTQISNVIKVGGRAIFVVGRRRTGGFRLKLDQFVADAVKARGFALSDIWERPLHSKRLPRVINRLGAARNAGHGTVETMRTEYVVVLRRRK